MLSDHERRQLTLIEQEFMARDPAYVARWCSLARKVRRGGVPLRTRQDVRQPVARAARRGPAGLLPIVLLASGLVFLLLGGALAEASVVVVGILLAVTALGIAIVAPRQSPRPDTA